MWGATLRPMTLFSSKFESYLNDAGLVNTGPGTYQQQPQQGPTNIPDWAEEDRRKQAQIKTNKERMTAEQAACYKHNQELYSQLIYQKLTFFEKDKQDLTFEQEEYLENWDAFVLPACAGVILGVASSVPLFVSFTRMRGGDPTYDHGSFYTILFYPHARG